jgi:hypothetical protein
MDSQPGGIDFFESIPELLQRLQFRAQSSQKTNMQYMLYKIKSCSSEEGVLDEP